MNRLYWYLLGAWFGVALGWIKKMQQADHQTADYDPVQTAKDIGYSVARELDEAIFHLEAGKMFKIAYITGKDCYMIKVFAIDVSGISILGGEDRGFLVLQVDVPYHSITLTLSGFGYGDFPDFLEFLVLPSMLKTRSKKRMGQIVNNLREHSPMRAAR